MVGNRRRHDGKSRERCERQASIAGRIGGSVESPGFYRALVECPECDGTVRSDERRNERVCRACGLVVATDHLARGPTKHGPADGDTGQVTTPVTVARHDRGLGTLIDWRDRDANGNWMSEAKRRRIARLRTYNRRCRSGSGKKRTVQAGLVEIARLTSELDLPDVVQDDAAILFRRAVDQDLLVGRSVEGIAGACTYAAARRHGLPRTLDELTALSHVDRTKVGRGYRYISRELELTIPPVDPKSHVRRLVATLGYGRNVHRRACDFVDAADSARHSRRRTPPHRRLWQPLCRDTCGWGRRTHPGRTRGYSGPEHSHPSTEISRRPRRSRRSANPGDVRPDSRRQLIRSACFRVSPCAPSDSAVPVASPSRDQP